MKTHIIFLFSALYAFFNASAALIIKKKLLTYKIIGMKDFIVFLIDPTIAFAFLLIFISMFFSMKALSLSSFSFVIPLTIAINFIFTISIGVIFFKDQLQLVSYIGLVLILVGIILLAQSYGGHSS